MPTYLGKITSSQDMQEDKTIDGLKAMNTYRLTCYEEFYLPDDDSGRSPLLLRLTQAIINLWSRFFRLYSQEGIFVKGFS